ncbi:MAG: hypothetical protein V5A34_07265 [Halapricum sp.]
MDRTTLWLVSGIVVSAVGLWLIVTSPVDSLPWLFGVWIAFHGLGGLLIGAWWSLRR